MSTKPPIPDATGVCLYRRADGRNWWRVDASVTPAGDIDIVSGDASEWHAVVKGAAKDALLHALRRTGDLTAGIGASREEEILARLHAHFHRDEDAPHGPFEAIKAFLDGNGVAWEARFWAGDTDDPPAPPRDGALLAVLGKARALLARPGNDFTWSSWQDREAALAELDRLVASIGTDAAPDRATLALIFSPAGPMQETSLASGWAQEFLELAAAFDDATGRDG